MLSQVRAQGECGLTLSQPIFDRRIQVSDMVGFYALFYTCFYCVCVTSNYSHLKNGNLTD